MKIRLRYSLRLLFVALTVAALVTHLETQQRRLDVSMQHLQALGVDAMMRGASWRRVPVLGRYARSVESLDFAATAKESELEELQYLHGLRGLESIRLPTTVRDEHMKYLSSVHSLQRIDLSYSHVRGPGLAWLRKLDHLNSLNLQGSPGVTDDTTLWVSRLVSVRDLDLSSTAITDDGLASLAGMLSLEKLSLGHTRISDIGLSYIAHLPNLRKLELGDTDVTGRGLHKFRSAPQLECLDLRLIDASVKLFELPLRVRFHSLRTTPRLFHVPSAKRLFVERWAAFESLQNLSLAGRILSQDQFQTLCSLRQIECLDLAGSNVDGDALTHLPRLRSLRHLGLSGTPIRDQDMNIVARMTGLVSLDVSGTAITDRGLKRIENLPQLKELYVSVDGATVTTAAVVALCNDRRLDRLFVAGKPDGPQDKAGLQHALKGTSVHYLDVQLTDLINDAKNAPH